MTARRSHVVTSHLHVHPDGARTLEEAFADRLGEVEDAPGFQHLEVWRDTTAEGRYVMVSWWDSVEDFRTYMASEPHRRSHARIPRDPHAPHADRVDRYEVIAR